MDGFWNNVLQQSSWWNTANNFLVARWACKQIRFQNVMRPFGRVMVLGGVSSPLFRLHPDLQSQGRWLPWTGGTLREKSALPGSGGCWLPLWFAFSTNLNYLNPGFIWLAMGTAKDYICSHPPRGMQWWGHALCPLTCKCSHWMGRGLWLGACSFLVSIPLPARDRKQGGTSHL